ncbi:MAG TPA: sigma-70 family RNA polymerase sigma factor [Cyclobacteriaceae bacterium]|nr:sigma-70 family RNA polymerase sigma factor [Cyclobacteriaceae bacterium]
MNIIKASDQKLVSQYIKGNEEAFAQLVKRHKSRVYTTINLIVKDRYLAEDLLQETFIKAINTIKTGRYNEEGKFLPWIVRIAHNLAVDHFRRVKRYPTIIMEDGSPIFNTIQFSEDSFENVQIVKDTHDKLKNLIQELPLAQKEVLVMRHYMKMSFKEIAETTGVSINTTLGRMRYALINLRKKMILTKSAYDKNFYPD